MCFAVQAGCFWSHSLHCESASTATYVRMYSCLGTQLPSSGVAHHAHGHCLPIQGVHISQLPADVLRLILTWVVSEDLDLLSLERFSAVSDPLFPANSLKGGHSTVCHPHMCMYYTQMYYILLKFMIR